MSDDSAEEKPKQTKNPQAMAANNKGLELEAKEKPKKDRKLNDEEHSVAEKCLGVWEEQEQWLEEEEGYG